MDNAVLSLIEQMLVSNATLLRQAKTVSGTHL